MPASVSYWVNALGGTPLLCLHKASPETDQGHRAGRVLAPAAPGGGAGSGPRPDQAGRRRHPGVRPRGLEPGPVKRLARRGIACITWPRTSRARTGRRRISAPLTLREPVLTSSDPAQGSRSARFGRSPDFTTHPQMPLAIRRHGAGQDSYMREQFNLDSLPSHDLEPA